LGWSSSSDGPEDANLKSNDPRMIFAAAADESFNYVAIDVIDTTIVSAQHETVYWNEDSVHF